MADEFIATAGEEIDAQPFRLIDLIKAIMSEKRTSSHFKVFAQNMRGTRHMSGHFERDLSVELKMYRLTILAIAFFSLGLGCGKSPPPVSGGKTTEQWVNALHNEDPKVRLEAVKKLGNIGSKHDAALNAVYEALTDDMPLVRQEAVYAVVRNWPTSRDALPILEAMKTQDEDPKIRKIAEEAHKNLTAGK